MSTEPDEPESVESEGQSRVPRRLFLKAAGIAAAATAGAAGVAAAASGGRTARTPQYVLPKGYAGDMSDLKHVVILMQENRSFDHYLGQLPGVRGHADKQVLTFQNGADVFHQADTSGVVTTPYSSTTTWGDNHNFYGANDGRWNTWVPDKGSNSMGYYDPSYMPFYYSMAAQYTVADQNFCSLHGPTIPNRYYLMTGKSNGEIDNSNQNNYLRSWLTVPEQLQQAGVDWRIYSDNTGNGYMGSSQGGFLGEYGCNVVNSFKAYDPRGLAADDPKLTPGTGLIWRANSYVYSAAPAGTPNDDSEANLEYVLRDFIAACKPDAAFPLPEISWVVMPAAWSEHPGFDTQHGERYVQKVMETLEGNQDLWNHTLVILTYDENDGKFDHVLPPRPEAGTAGEFSGTTPLGFGPRVPMLLVSPWTRGGYVATEVFDHTSVIKLLEVWTAFLGKPFTCSNITDWRRSIAGDLTSAIDFAHPQLGPDTFADPVVGTPPPLAADNMKHRPLSFQPHATLVEDRVHGTVTASMTLTGGPKGKAVSFQVFPDAIKPFTNTPFTVTAAKAGTYAWDATQSDGKYAFSIYSNDGFVRSFTGQLVPATRKDTGIPRVEAALASGADGKLKLTLHNDGTEPVRFMLTANDYLGGIQVFHLTGGAQQLVEWPTEEGYYDVVISADTASEWTQRYAGRVATA